MGRKVFAILFLVMLPMLAWAYSDGDFFTANIGLKKYDNSADSGSVDVKFQVISESLKTCRVCNYSEYSIYNKAIDENTTGWLNIPSSVGEYTVVEIGSPYCGEESDGASFGGCTKIARIELPNTITTIHTSSFRGCSTISHFNIPSSVATIGLAAFKSSGLKEITLPSTVSTIGARLFELCENLKTVTIETEIVELPAYTFSSCYLLQNISLPNSITAIGDEAFSSCRSLASITLPNVLESLGTRAFAGCEKLRSIDLPSTLSSLGDGCFNCQYGASDAGLYSITIPAGITSIGSYTFCGQRVLESVSFLGDITSIGMYAFSGCIKLSSITISSTVTSIGQDAFSECILIESVSVPGSSTTIGDWAFRSCVNLKKIVIGEGVKTIGGEAFKDISTSSQVRVILPSTLTTINDYAFFKAGGTAYDNVTFYVPTSSKSSYESGGAFYSAFKMQPYADNNKILTITEPVLNTQFTVSGITYKVTSTSPAQVQVVSVETDATSITIPEEVFKDGVFYPITDIANSAFNANCPNLTNVTTEFDPSFAFKVGKIEVSGESSIVFGQTTTLTATVTPTFADDKCYTWASNKPTVATIDADGKITTLAKDTEGVTFTATASDGSGTIGTKTLTIIPASATISITDLTKTYNRADQTPTIAVTDGTNAISSYEVTYNGAATLPKDAGEYEVAVTANGNYTGSDTKTFTIAPKALSGEEVTLSATSLVYNKANQKPTVTVKDGEATLVADTEYTLTNEGGTDVGAAYPISVVGKGNYSGTINKTFVITPASATISITDLAKTYNRNNQVPTITVTDGTDALPTSSYTITYDGGSTLPKDAGSYEVVVTANGNYTGSNTKTFTIAPKALSGEEVTLSATSLVYNKANQKPTVTVKDGEVILVADTEYTLTNEGGTNVNAAYPISVVGKGNYSGTVNKTFAITPASATISITDLAKIYNRNNQVPTISVTDGTDALPTSSYTITYDGGSTLPKDAGSYEVVVTANGNYTGSNTKTFTIAPKALSGEEVTLSATSLVYNKANQKPTVTVKDGEVILVADTEYTLTNEGGTNVNAAYPISVVGKGNYSGTVNKTFAITPASATISITDLAKIYNRNNQVPTISVTDGTDALPTSSYTVTYAGGSVLPKDAGSYEVVVTANGNYTGSDTKTFTINPKALSADDVTLSANSFVYNKANQKPTVTVKDGEATLVADTEYILTNEGGTDVNAAYPISVVGKGNYSGTINKSFAITPASATISITDLTKPYNRAEQVPTISVTDGTSALPASSYAVTYNGSATLPKNAGEYEVMVTASGNYTGSATKTFSISPKELLAKVGNYEMTEGEDVPTFVITYEGFVSGEDESVLEELPTASTTATSLSPAGEYAIIVSGGSAKNYTFTYQDGILTINKATGIGIIRFESEVDVFDLRGNKVASKVKSLKGLPKGVYIVNGKKVIKK